MIRASHKQAISAFVFGLWVCIPAIASSGGDVCAPFQHSVYDRLQLQLTSTTIDGVAQPLTVPAESLSIFSEQIDASSDAVDDIHAAGWLPNPRQPSETILVYLKRQP